MIEVKFDEAKLREATVILDGIKNAMPKAISRAINRAMTAAKTEASKQARQEYIIKAAGIKATFTTRKATSSKLLGEVKSTGKTIKLGDFYAKQGKKGLIAKVKKGSTSQKISGAFIGTSHKGFTGVMKRQTSASYPLEVLYGPSIPQMLGSPKISEQIQTRAAEMLNDRLEHEINNIFKGYGG